MQTSQRKQNFLKIQSISTGCRNQSFQDLEFSGHCCLALIDCQAQLDKPISCWVQRDQAENMNSLSASFVEELLQFGRQSNLLQCRLLRRPIYQYSPNSVGFHSLLVLAFHLQVPLSPTCHICQQRFLTKPVEPAKA